MDFIFVKGRDNPEMMHHEVKLLDTHTKEVFYDKLTFIYLELPKFRKTEDELETNFDRWMYLLNHMEVLDRCPAALQTKIFEKAFQVAEIARYTPIERRSYEESLKVYRDLINVVTTARQKGLKKGEEKGLKKGMEIGLEQGLQQGLKQGLQQGRGEIREAIARKAIAQGLSIELIISLTGLTAEEIERLGR